MKNAIKEMQVWSVFMTVGALALATEVAVTAEGSLVTHAPRSAIPPVTAMSPAVPAVESAPAEPATVRTEELVTDLLVESVVQIESAGNPRSVGRQGERGLMQIMKATWKETTAGLFGKPLPFDKAFDPAMNRRVGTAYLATLHDFLQANRGRWQADERSLLLACYNAGPQRVAAAGFNLRRLPRSTQDYVARATALHDAYLKEFEIELVMNGGADVLGIVQLGPNRET